jgi:hypothetical protein
VLYFVA